MDLEEKRRNKKEIKEEAGKFQEKVALEVVSLLICGESWYKWDSTSSYFPTVVFIFNEDVEDATRRRTQIKARLKKKSDELTDADIEKLKRNVLVHKDWSYFYGSTKAYFVSAEKRWKTSIFVKDTGEAAPIFQTIGEIIEEIDLKLIV